MLDPYMWYITNLKESDLALFLTQEIPKISTSWGFKSLLKKIL